MLQAYTVRKGEHMSFIDLHTHSLASTHAYNTITELIAQAGLIGLSGFAITDHAPAMADSPHPWHFNSLVDEIPFKVNDIVVIKGIEANVLNADGETDLKMVRRNKLDWVIASIHGSVLPPTLTSEQVDFLWEQVAANPDIDMIGHSESPRYPYDFERLTKIFKDSGKIVELNTKIFGIRSGNMESFIQLALACKRNKVPVALGSDAHSIYTLGKFEQTLSLLQALEFPEELIVNRSPHTLAQAVKYTNPKLAHKLAEAFEFTI